VNNLKSPPFSTSGYDFLENVRISWDEMLKAEKSISLKIKKKNIKENLILNKKIFFLFFKY
jgi:hypothetical protein